MSQQRKDVHGGVIFKAECKGMPERVFYSILEITDLVKWKNVAKSS
jgi:hypothetical protein